MTIDQTKILQVKNLRTEFHTDKGIIRVVDGISFDVGKGKVVGLVGESGCGKSMTALSVMGLVAQPPGRVAADGIILDGQDLTRLSAREMCGVRGNAVSMVFQEPMTSLNPIQTVGHQVIEPLSIRRHMNRKEKRDRVTAMFELVGIPEPAARIDAYPHQLSGGLRQRAMIAMALICEPKLLIADEPTTALDVTIQAQILKLMLELRDRMNTAIIMITHDLGVIAETCDEVNVMYAGQIIEKSDVFGLFDAPAHPYTRGLMKSIPGLAAEKKLHRLNSIKGMVPNLLHVPPGCRFQPRCGEALPICALKSPPVTDLGNGHQVACWLHNRAEVAA